jgi:hypothetical protein
MITEMLIADILTLPSCDSDGAARKNDLDWTVANALNYVDVTKDRYIAIRDEMEHDGYNRVPLHVDYAERLLPYYYAWCPDELKSSKAMGNGHNRLKIMIELGFTHARVTDDPTESDDTGEEHYLLGYAEWDEDDY